jgi:ABC-type Fe3+-siderophore transport system permease subunit
MRQTHTDYPRLAAKIAIAAALLGAIADVLLLYSPNGGYEVGDYAFLKDISTNRIVVGHYLGIFFIPLEMLGLFHIYRCLSPAGGWQPWAVVIGALFVGYPGVAYHGMVAFIHTLVNQGTTDAALIEHLRLLSEPVGGALAVGGLAVAGLFAYIVLKKNTFYPKWMAWCNPGTFYILFALSYLVIPPVGNVLLPAAFNLSFLLFFSCSLLAERKNV